MAHSTTRKCLSVFLMGISGCNSEINNINTKTELCAYVQIQDLGGWEF